MKKINNYFIGNILMGFLQVWVTIVLLFSLAVGAHHFVNMLGIF